MDKEKLDAFLEAVKKTEGVKASDYSASSEVKEDSENAFRETLNNQIPKHRALLLGLVFGLTIASFLLLAGIISFQMLWTIRHAEYVGVSDKVINTLAIGVFAELVGVVGIIVKLVWKNPK
ncbi:MAG TPA: hypothetical protein VK674_07405 [Candidatus Limnocylindria bacterium]|nr:hypothetical protein [Candidatus Limnocylindria bacterium]